MNYIKNIFLKDIKEFMRDKRTLIFSVLLPVLVGPISIFGIRVLMEKNNVNKNSIAYTNISNQNDFISTLDAKVWNLKAVDNWKESLIKDEIDVALNVPNQFETKVNALEMPELELHYDNMRLKENGNLKVAQLEIKNVQGNVRRKLAESMKLTPQQTDSIQQPFEIIEMGIATDREKAGLELGLPLVISLMLMALTGMIPITLDIGAGEKERGTLESILTSPHSKWKLAAGKSLAVMLVGVFILFLDMICLSSIIHLLSEDITILDIMLCGFVSIPFVLCTAPILLALSVYASNYKEAQNYITSFMILGLMIAVPFVSSQSQSLASMFWAPVLNSMFAIREIAQGTFSATMIAPIYLIGILIAALGIMICKKIYELKSF